MYVVCVTFDIKAPDFRSFVEAVGLQARNSLQKESGCHVFDVCTDPDSSRVFLYEHYTDRPAFDRHLESDHFLDFDAQTRPWVKSKQIVTWQLLEHIE